MRPKTVILAIALASIPNSSSARTPEWSAIAGNLSSQVRAEGEPGHAIAVRMRHSCIPGVSVAVVRQGRLAWAHAWGMTSIANPVPVDRHTLFAAASMTKPMTALVALRLVERGILSLDEDVNSRLVGWRIPFAKGVAPAPVTLRQLLAHSAGITEYGDLGYGANQSRADSIEVLQGTRPDVSPPIAAEHTPGEAMRYSNPGYLIIQKLIEDVTHEQFATVARREVLEPLRMAESRLEQPLLTRSRNVATGSSGCAPLAQDAKVATELAPGGLWSTPTDMARLMIGIDDAFRGRKGAIIDPAMGREMLRIQPGGWGLGIGVEGARASLRFGHTGAFAGFESLMTMLAQRGDGIVVMTNGEGGQQLGAEILRAAAARYGWQPFKARTVKPAAAQLDRIRAHTGYYASDAGQAWVSLRSSAGWLISDRGGWSRLIPVAAGKFVSANNGTEVTILGRTSGAPPSISLGNGASAMVLTRRPYLVDGPQLYLRGTMNGWDQSAPLVAQGPRTRTLSIRLGKGLHRFKIASADWQAVDIGAAAGSGIVHGSGSIPLEPWGAAITLSLDSSADILMSVDLDNPLAPQLTISRKD